MTKAALAVVKAEMTRMAAKINELEASQKGSEYYFASKQSGAVRRASLDLTRALADLRRP